MSRTAKLILGLVVGLTLADMMVAVSGLLLICSLGSALARSFETGPLRATEITASITDYALLPGPGDVPSPRTVGFSIDSDTDGYSRIIRFQFPGGLGLELAEAAGEWPATQTGPYQALRVQAPGSQTRPAQGQELSLVIRQGKAPDGQAYRQVAGILRGEDRQASVVFTGPREDRE